jgi:hypothetical protein
LIEGIQDYEKIRILKDEFAAKDQAKLKEMESILSAFSIEKLSTISAEQMVIEAKEKMNKL